MFKQILFLLAFFYVAPNAFAQHLELSENKGELGGLWGLASYKGDIAPDVQVYYRNYGVFVKKQLNSYVGIRLNVEMQHLASHDMLSEDPYALSRNANFKISTMEASVMSEFYFLNYIAGSSNKKFTPYLGVGLGYLYTLETIRNNNTSVVLTSSDPIKQSLNLSFPLNVGLKYNIYRQFNLLGELTYRFTTTDNIDFLNENPTAITAFAPLGFQGSTSGNDQFFSAKLGISYSFNKIFGMEQNKTQHPKGLLNRLKRK